MKDKVLQQLKTKYSKLGLSDKVLDKMADTIVAKITEESEIETAVAGVEDLLKTFQSDSDKRVTDAVSKAKTTKQDPKTETDGDKPAGDGDAAAQAIAAVVQQAVAPLVAKIQALESGNTSKSRREVLESKLKDANQTVKTKILKDFDRMSFKDDAEFDAYIAETETDLGELSKSFTETNLGQNGRPMVGTGTVTTATADADIKAWAGEGKADK